METKGGRRGRRRVILSWMVTVMVIWKMMVILRWMGMGMGIWI